MKFGMTGETAVDVFDKLLPIRKKIANFLSGFFEHRSYGAGLEKILIGIICVKPTSESFYEVRINYTKSENLLVYNVKIPHQSVLQEHDESVIVSIFSKELIASLDTIENLKIPDFDFQKFKADFSDAIGLLQSECQ